MKLQYLTHPAKNKYIYIYIYIYIIDRTVTDFIPLSHYNIDRLNHDTITQQNYNSVEKDILYEKKYFRFQK